MFKASRSRDDHGQALHHKDGRWLYGAEGLEPAPAEDAEILVGYVKEKAFVNNKVSDLNNNGRQDDVFGMIAYLPAEAAEDNPWVAFLDTDADGDLSDERPLHDFAVAQESFHLGVETRRVAIRPDLRVGPLVVLKVTYAPAGPCVDFRVQPRKIKI